MNPNHAELVTIFGGSGFVGSQVVQALARKGYRIRVAVRRPNLAVHTRMFGAVGQIQPIAANVTNQASIERAIRGADIVINLAAVGFERGSQSFKTVNVDGAGAVAAAALAAGATGFIHMSVLGADPESESDFARSRAEGEAAVLAAFPGASILRPSLIFGQGDEFFTLMGSLSRIAPVLPVIGGHSRFQPVYVGDVADAIAVLADPDAPSGKVYELGGPEIVTMKELMAQIVAVTGRNRPLLSLPAGIAKLIAAPLSILPKPLLTSDRVTWLQQDNVVSEAAEAEGRTLSGLGVNPTPMAAILPTYLWQFRRNGQFDRQTA